MNKTAIKNFAIWARVNLIEAVKQRAYEYEITKDGTNNASLESVGGRILSRAERDQRRALINKISEKGFDQVMEEAAYTWFNRFIALRFMEVNGYLPARVRVFTNEEGEFKPEIMKEAMTVEIEGLKRDIVLDLIDKQNNEELFKYLIITQCNALGNGLPKMFEKIEHWTELLFPANLLRADSVVDRMVSDIPEEDFSDIEIIGWMYQYYITEPHERIVNPLHGKAYTKEEVPAATQIFTTEWVVKYIVDNSLGRYWIERNPESSLKEKLEYLVVPKSGSFELVKESIRPQDITVLDPCVGSGHFLSYAFEVLMMIYTECGWSERDAAKSIVENNLFGIDIDERAGQLAYFTIMMKARKYNRRALAGGEAGVLPNIYAIIESNNISRFAVEDFCDGKADVLAEMDKLLRTMKDAREYGSIIEFKDINFELLLNACDASYDRITLHGNEIREDIIPLIKMAHLMSKKYDIVVTNPPYMNKFSPKLKDYINANYAAYKGDLFSVFIYKSLVYCKQSGYAGLMTPNVWMFIKSYEELRKFIIEKKNITTLVQMAKGAFFKEATVDVCGFVLQNAHSDKNGQYIRLEDFKGDMDVQGQRTLEALENKDCGYYYETTASNFSKIPGSPIAYWAHENLIKIFTAENNIGQYADVRIGMGTGNNDLFLRQWWEISIDKIGFGFENVKAADASKKKFFPYGKGGECRRWYGNQDKVVWYDELGRKEMDNTSGHRENGGLEKYFHRSLTWSYNTTGAFNARYMPQGFVFDVNGSSIFPKDERYEYILAFLCTVVCRYILSITNATITTQAGNIRDLPLIVKSKENVILMSEYCINQEKEDWNSFETSWDFKKHPLV